MTKQICQINGCTRTAEGHRMRSYPINLAGTKWAEIDVCVEHYINIHSTRQVPFKKHSSIT